MEFTVSGTTVRFDERTMQFAFTRDGAEWNACADFKPTLQCAQGTFAFADAASITHEQRETGTGTGIRSIFTGFGHSAYSFETYVWVERASGDVLFEWIPLNEQGLNITNVTWPAAMDFDCADDHDTTLITHEQGVMIPNTWPTAVSTKDIAFDGRFEPFYEPVHKVRAHRGQLETARNFRELLKGSELIARHKEHVQDPYSFRCIPQVHGASKDTIDYVESVITTEINSVTDNPTVFPDEDIVISAGNFHGQPIAVAMDFLAIAVSELGNISERRTYKLISGSRGLPSFLVANPGLNSGFMIPQYTAASIVSQSKGLCMPASADSIPSSQGQEDHVSMGSNAATKLYRVVNNTERVLAIELFNAAQALEFRRPLKSSPAIEAIFTEYRKRVPFISNDEIMYPHIESSVQFVRGM